MNEFNQDNRTKNVIRSSTISMLCTALNTLLGFAYRTCFIHILSEKYLGISGLFTNVLTILSLSELGITNALTFRLYDPINRSDSIQVGRIMNTFRKVYISIALVILCLGLAILPFLNFLIKDANEVPQDVNLTIVYLLFLMQTVVSYTYSYRQMLLVADQKQHVYSLFQSLLSFLRYSVQLLILAITRNYTYTLVSGIAVIIVVNYTLYSWTGHKYCSVFSVRESLSKTERSQVFADTKATMCHKIGGVVVTGTDNILVTKFVGLAVTGIYSNYSMLLTYLQSLLAQAFSSFTGSLGSAHVSLDRNRNYDVFKKLQFICFWASSVVTVCVYILMNDFISSWLGKALVLDDLSVAVLSAQFYLYVDSLIVASYTSGSGLFVKDKLRPLLEAVINLSVSIFLALKIGLAGIFLGTVISHLCTFSWRGPFVLYKNEFKTSSKRYWLAAVFFAGITALACHVFERAKVQIGFQVRGFGVWFVEALICFVLINAILLVFLWKTEEFQFFLTLFKKKLHLHA